MPNVDDASLDTDARQYLTAKRAPMTAGNLQSIKDYLSMNPDQRPSRGAGVTGPSRSTVDDASSASDEGVIDKRVRGMLDAEKGNTNPRQQASLDKKINLGTSQSIGSQGAASRGGTDPRASRTSIDMQLQNNAYGTDPMPPPAAPSIAPTPVQQYDDSGMSLPVGAGEVPVDGTGDGGSIPSILKAALAAAGIGGAGYLAMKGRGMPGAAAPYMHPGAASPAAAVVQGGAASPISALTGPPARLAIAPPTTGGAIPMGAPAPQLALPAPAVAAAVNPVEAAINKTIAAGAPPVRAALPSPRMAVATDPRLRDVAASAGLVKGNAERDLASRTKSAADASLDKINAKAERKAGESSPIGEGKKIAAREAEKRKQGSALRSIVSTRNKLKKKVGT